MRTSRRLTCIRKLIVVFAVATVLVLMSQPAAYSISVNPGDIARIDFELSIPAPYSFILFDIFFSAVSPDHTIILELFDNIGGPVLDSQTIISSIPLSFDGSFISPPGLDDGRGFMDLTTTGAVDLTSVLITGYDTSFAGSVVDGVISVIPSPEPMPEPSTMLLLGSGLAGLGFVRRRRKAA